MLNNSARSLKIFRKQWLANYYRLKRPALAAWRKARAKQQQIIAVHVKKLSNLWLHNNLLPLLKQALAKKLTATHSAVLSPFDPVVWDRKRAKQLFNFSYRLKCYTPAPKRQYGYFVLPLLHRGQLVGQINAKMHRQTGILKVISLWLQKGIKPTTTLQKGLRQAITNFANWQQATRVTLKCCPQGLFTNCRTG